MEIDELRRWRTEDHAKRDCGSKKENDAKAADLLIREHKNELQSLKNDFRAGPKTDYVPLKLISS